MTPDDEEKILPLYDFIFPAEFSENVDLSKDDVTHMYQETEYNNSVMKSDYDVIAFNGKVVEIIGSHEWVYFNDDVEETEETNGGDAGRTILMTTKAIYEE